ncbi:MAG: hypothetical protein ACXU82_19330 [Caulobacteraceae bacterium]
MTSKLLAGGAALLALSIGAGPVLAQQAPVSESQAGAAAGASADGRDVPPAPPQSARTAPKSRREDTAAKGNVVTSTLGGVPRLVGSTVGGGFRQAGSTIGGALGVGKR